jgi:hypothetical protein
MLGGKAEVNSLSSSAFVCLGYTGDGESRVESVTCCSFGGNRIIEWRRFTNPDERILLCRLLPFMKSVSWKTDRVIVYEFGTRLAKPDAVGCRSSLIIRKIGLISWTTRRGGCDVRSHTDI